MPDPMNTKICLADGLSGVPIVSLFLVPEPRVPGASMLHLLEQDPLYGRAVHRPATTLLEWLENEAPGRRAIGTRFLAYASGVPDAARVHAILRDHFIADTTPLGLDTADPNELTRLEMLPEHRLGPRRIDDFHDHAVRRAMLAVYRHFEVDRRIPLVYHGYADPVDGWFESPAAQA
ncbi:hypothetical protein HLB23_08265 [Nocardia uniformis]|uniref:Uncharacterized protein n=1 Tax=Nocardia uniformis TaxID=53432 RepID=A0A849C4H0_9NOCA|nr:hypothetical protein [Nocardia uniformis]NNH69859.1 hypothetical protein [Nocardia uniformis]